MLADIHILHQSDFYRITDFKCHCDLCSVSNPEYNDSMCLSFIRKGFFEYQTFKRKEEIHTGRLLLSKPGYEHIARHIEGQPDITTVYEFTENFFKTMQEQYKDATWFLSNNDIHSLMIQSNPDLDYMHERIMKLMTQKPTHLQMDDLVLELLEATIGVLTNTKPLAPIADSFKKFHLDTIEKAKTYIFENFNKDISLHELARHCLVSPYHFSRIFKSIMDISPHQYLTAIRLNHAKVLLTTTEQSITGIAFACAFSSIEHFATAYKQKFKLSPTAQRKQIQ